MNDHRNTILAIVLSAIILIAWQYFFALPQAEKQKAQQQAQQTQQGAPAPQTNGAPAAPGAPSRDATAPRTREAALADSKRIAIETPSISGSISLKGARIDDVALVRYRETVDPKSPAIVLLSPSGSPHPYYAEFGWVPAAGGNVRVPGADTVWTQDGEGKLTPSTPVKLSFDNGAGLVFRRTIAVDANYLFTIRDEVENKSGNAATLYPYALVSRHGMPHTAGYYVLHEGMIGVLGEQGLQEISYSKLDDKKTIPFNVTNAWLGITDKYWAATLLPNTDAKVQARFTLGSAGTTKTYQADYLGEPVTVAPNASVKTDARLFAGAKEVSLVDAYDKALKLNRFELLIDWGWFYFITKPMFWAIDLLYKLLGNFGLAILAVTVVIKAIFFPLANKSYASMAKMKAAQPKMMEIRERFADDKMKQQQEMMELYKKEKINPVSGCLPIVIQIPVFFSLYKVLFVTIEMRHAPFFGWIRDLSAPDPTNLFTLFGLIPWDPGALPVIGPFLLLGIWPIIMGITMWFQMKLNPAPPDPTQQMIFDWMPLIFTFMLASFPAGLVIYWAWNNFLSVLQQAAIMRRHGVKIELMDNLRAQFGGKKKTQS